MSIGKGIAVGCIWVGVAIASFGVVKEGIPALLGSATVATWIVAVFFD